MTIEKIGSGRRFSHAVGVVLILGGIAFVAGAFVAHWPGARELANNRAKPGGLETWPRAGR